MAVAWKVDAGRSRRRASNDPSAQATQATQATLDLIPVKIAQRYQNLGRPGLAAAGTIVTVRNAGS